MKRSVRGKRRVDFKNLYILFVSAVAVLSLMGNIIQDHYYNQAIEIQQQTIDTIIAEYNTNIDFQTAMYD